MPQNFNTALAVLVASVALVVVRVLLVADAP
jgi:hypothetical protein